MRCDVSFVLVLVLSCGPRRNPTRLLHLRAKTSPFVAWVLSAYVSTMLLRSCQSSLFSGVWDGLAATAFVFIISCLSSSKLCLLCAILPYFLLPADSLTCRYNCIHRLLSLNTNQRVDSYYQVFSLCVVAVCVLSVAVAWFYFPFFVLGVLEWQFLSGLPEENLCPFLQVPSTSTR